MAEIVVREVDRTTWSDFAALFESPGGPKHCWCMAWRPMNATARKGTGKVRQAAMKRLVDAGTPVGLLAYEAGVPIGWCSIAPRETYRPLGGPEEGDKVWSLACFFLKREKRGSKLAEKLLRSAIDHVARKGGDMVEAYPVDPDSPSYRFMGFVDLFRRNGFEEIGRAGSRRHVMRLVLSGKGVGHGNTER